jgi:prepilin-type N-terminal cleavage/methylation domain-containing protein
MMSELRTMRITASSLPVRTQRRFATLCLRASGSPSTTSKYAARLANEQRIQKSGLVQGGFTLVELLIAMAIFSLMLLVIVSGFLQVVRIQQAAVASRNTQHNARFALEEMVREARTASEVTVITGPPGPAPLHAVCLRSEGGLVRYQVSSSRLYRASYPLSGSCSSPPPSGERAMTAPDVAVVRLQATATSTGPVVPPQPGLRISIGVASTADTSRLQSADQFRSCNQSLGGSQYCSVTNLESSVTLRGIR